jgi:hypothetical protein
MAYTLIKWGVKDFPKSKGKKMPSYEAIAVDTVYMVDFKWTDPDDGKKWLYFREDGSYETFKAMPKMLSLDGILFQKSGSNSDSGLIAYRQADVENMAKVVEK